MSEYTGKDFCKQLEEIMKKCDNLSLEMKTQKKEYTKKIYILEHRVLELEMENEVLKNDNDRLKKQLTNDSNNSSKPPSTDIKRNIPNNRTKSNKKSGGQKGHAAHFLDKKEIERKIANHELKHEIIDVGKEYNIQKEFQTDVQYGNELKTMCSILNTEGIVAIDRLTDFDSSISHGKIDLSKGTIVNFLNTLSKKSEYVIEQIKQKILNSELMYTDATTARCNKGCNENTNNKWALKMRSFLCFLNEYKKELKSKNIEKIEDEKLEKYSKRYDEIIEEGYREKNKKIKSKFLRQEEQRLLNRLKNIKSIIGTCKKQAINFYEIISNLYKDTPVTI